MKPSTFVAAAAVIGGSLLIPNPADALGTCEIDTEIKSFDFNFPGSFVRAVKLNLASNFFRSVSRASQFNVASSRCPAGTRYHKIRVGGLIKRTAAEGCFTDFQASQLRMQANANQQQRIRNFQQNLNESFRSPVNCSGTVNSLGVGLEPTEQTATD